MSRHNNHNTVQQERVIDGWGPSDVVMTKLPSVTPGCDEGTHCAAHGADHKFFCCRCGAEFRFATDAERKNDD